MGVLSILVAGLPLHGGDAAGGLHPGPGPPIPALQPHPCAALVSPWPPTTAQAFSPQGPHAPPSLLWGPGLGLELLLGVWNDRGASCSTCDPSGGIWGLQLTVLVQPSPPSICLFPGDGLSGAGSWLSVLSLALPLLHVYGDGVLRVWHAGDAGQRAREALPRVPGPRVSLQAPLLPPPPPPGHSRAQAFEQLNSDHQ